MMSNESADSIANMEERLTSMEMSLAYQDDYIKKLNDVVLAQQTEINKLELSLKKMGEKLKNLADNGTDNMSADEKPPHY